MFEKQSRVNGLISFSTLGNENCSTQSQRLCKSLTPCQQRLFIVFQNIFQRILLMQRFRLEEWFISVWMLFTELETATWRWFCLFYCGHVEKRRESSLWPTNVQMPNNDHLKPSSFIPTQLGTFLCSKWSELSTLLMLVLFFSFFN